MVAKSGELRKEYEEELLKVKSERSHVYIVGVHLLQ